MEKITGFYQIQLNIEIIDVKMPVEYILLESKRIDEDKVSIEAMFGFNGGLDLPTILEARRQIGKLIMEKFPNAADYKLKQVIEIDSKTLVATIKGEAYV